MIISPERAAITVFIGALLLLVWLYIAARLMSKGVARSWREVWKGKNNNKEETE